MIYAMARKSGDGGNKFLVDVRSTGRKRMRYI
jgi:hypothetical protein